MLSKKIALFVGLTTLALTASAANLCPGLSGVWSGTYTVEGKSYPVNMFLDVQKSTLYAYTLPAQDKSGYNFGGSVAGNYLLWANCSNNTVSNLYYVNRPKKCGGNNPAEQTLPSGFNKPLVLAVPYNNTIVTLSLEPQNKPMPIKYGLLSRAKDLSLQTTWTACTP